MYAEVRSDMDKTRILVIGGGVNGSVCAAELYNAKIDVTVLARGKRYEEIREEGIIIESPFKNIRSVTKVPVINRLETNDVYEYVLVVIRKNQVTDLLPVLTQNKSGNIVFMGNNLSGADEFVKALGKERVMMGSVYAAGKRDGNIIRAMVVKTVASPFGEVDGTISTRLKRLAGIFSQAGFKMELTSDIIDHQTTHGASVALIGTLVCKHGCVTSDLARSKSDLRLYVEANREAHQVLRAIGCHILPKTDVVIEKMPIFLQVAGLRAMLGSKLGEVGVGWHCSQAPDEVQQMARELEGLIEKSGLATPAIRKVLQ
jgi:2-dehydropantoate 2-reductase